MANILQLCVKVPYPPHDGGSIAMYNIQRAITENEVTLKVLTFNTIKQMVDLNEFDEDYKTMTRIEGVYLDNRIKPFAAILNLFTSESYNIIRFIRQEFEQKLIEILVNEEFDVIQLESLYMVPYIETIRRYSKAKVVLRTHNIEHLIWQRLAMNATNPLRRWYLNLLYRRLKHYEIGALNRVDAIAALTREDKEQLMAMGATVPIHVAPIGVDLKNYPCLSMPEGNMLFHLGAMDWLPNQEGIKWFLQEVWPKLSVDRPEVRFKFAGKRMPPAFFNFKSDRVSVSDKVESIESYFADGKLMVVPLFSGSGMRVKIIEGMAFGKAIITTSIGLEGIPAIDGQEVIIANSPDEFIAKIKHALSHPELLILIGNNARKMVETKFYNRKIGAELLSFYQNLSKN